MVFPVVIDDRMTIAVPATYIDPDLVRPLAV